MLCLLVNLIGTKAMEEEEFKDQQHCETMFNDCIAAFSENDKDGDEKEKENQNESGGNPSSVDINMNVSDACDDTEKSLSEKYRQMWEKVKLPELPKIPQLPKIDTLFNLQ